MVYKVGSLHVHSHTNALAGKSIRFTDGYQTSLDSKVLADVSDSVKRQQFAASEVEGG